MELTIPIVANVLTIIHMAAVRVELSGFTAPGFSCSAGSNSDLSTSSPCSTSSGAFTLTKAAATPFFSLSSKASASVTGELTKFVRSAAIASRWEGVRIREDV